MFYLIKCRIIINNKLFITEGIIMNLCQRAAEAIDKGPECFAEFIGNCTVTEMGWLNELLGIEHDGFTTPGVLEIWGTFLNPEHDPKIRMRNAIDLDKIAEQWIEKEENKIYIFNIYGSVFLYGSNVTVHGPNYMPE